MPTNIIFVLLDGSRWDRLHISKDFEFLQNEGMMFNNISAAYPYTFAAINAMFTGKFGKENGVDAYYKMFRLKDNINFLPEILKKNGYFTACDLISDKVISSRGFDIHQSHDEHVDNLFERHPKFIEKIFSVSNKKPIFTFLQFSQIHTVTVTEVLKKYEWDDPEFYKNSKKNLENYDESFLQSTKYAIKIYDTIKKLGKLEDTVIIFFCDHGTGIGERFGERNYGVFLFEETIRTYHLFIGSNFQKNNISDKLFSSIQLFPTILDLANINPSDYCSVRSLVPYLTSMKNISEEKFTFSETGGLQGPFPSPKEPNVFCIKNSQFKLIYYKTPQKYELFDLLKDPKELQNIFGKGLSVESELTERLTAWISR